MQVEGRKLAALSRWERPDTGSSFSDFAAGTMREALSQDYDWTWQVSALKIPTLIIIGDADGLPPSHAVAFFTLLGGGLKDAGWNGEHLVASQLAILPGATHYNIISRADLLLPILAPFLDK